MSKGAEIIERTNNTCDAEGLTGALIRTQTIQIALLAEILDELVALRAETESRAK